MTIGAGWSHSSGNSWHDRPVVCVGSHAVQHWGGGGVRGGRRVCTQGSQEVDQRGAGQEHLEDLGNTVKASSSGTAQSVLASVDLAVTSQTDTHMYT